MLLNDASPQQKGTAATQQGRDLAMRFRIPDPQQAHIIKACQRKVAVHKAHVQQRRVGVDLEHQHGLKDLCNNSTGTARHGTLQRPVRIAIWGVFCKQGGVGTVAGLLCRNVSQCNALCVRGGGGGHWHEAMVLVR